MWKEYFYFNKSERRAVILLTVVLAVAITASLLLPRYKSASTAPCSQEILDKFDVYADSVRQKKNLPPRKERILCLQPFDPNTVGQETLISLGLPSWMANNILKYRAKGGVFRKAEDFKKIYGMTEEQFNTLLPYIQIKEKFTYKTPSDTRQYTEVQEEKVPIHKPSAPNPVHKIEKYAEGTLINLNDADTTELQHIPGIGPVTARRITYYRRKLGGFYSPQQLLEIDTSFEKFIPWFNVDTTRITPLEINKASMERLMKHPYLNFYQAKAIDEHRRNHGAFKNLKEVGMYDEFSEKDLIRLRPYLAF